MLMAWGFLSAVTSLLLYAVQHSQEFISVFSLHCFEHCGVVSLQGKTWIIKRAQYFHTSKQISKQWEGGSYMVRTSHHCVQLSFGQTRRDVLLFFFPILLLGSKGIVAVTNGIARVGQSSPYISGMYLFSGMLSYVTGRPFINNYFMCLCL